MHISLSVICKWCSCWCMCK